jgi:hypothetical protein
MWLPHQIIVTVPEGCSLRVDIEGTDGQFIISYGDPNYAPANETHEAVRVMAEMPDSTGRVNVIYEELYNQSVEEKGVERTAEVVHSNLDAEVLNINAGHRTSPFTPTLSLEQMLAGAIAVDPETGTIPTEPAPEAIAIAAGRPAPPTTSAGGDTPTEALEGAQSQSATARTIPPDARSMEDKAPRDGSPVILYYEDLTGLQVQPAKWSYSPGRQFWIDEGGETLGEDDGFLGWRPMTSVEREEYGFD